MNTDNETRVVLVASFDTQLARMLWRVLSRHFDIVHTATDIEQAEQILQQHAVTNIVCDRSFGTDQTSFELVSHWRRCHPSIRRAVIMTGVDYSDVRIPEGVDAVLLKSEPMQRLVEVLRD